MSVRIRLRRTGRKNLVSYRVVVTDARTKRDGKILENVGTYDPRNKDKAKQFAVDTDRLKYWLSVGAQPSETVARMLKRTAAKAT